MFFLFYLIMTDLLNYASSWGFKRKSFIGEFIIWIGLPWHLSWKCWFTVHWLPEQCRMSETVNISVKQSCDKMKWNESGFRPPLCTYRLNWARTTSWGWWDEWDDTVLQTQDSKFEPWRFDAEHATSRSRRLPTILSFTRGWGRHFLFLSNRRDWDPYPEL